MYRAARFSAFATLKVVADKGVTTLCAPPTVWRLFIQEDLKAYPVKLRELVGAGEPLNPEVIHQVEQAWGITIRDGYGQTETTAQAAVVPSPDPVRLAVPKAYIILRAGFEPDRATALSLFRFIRERLSPYKRVRILEFSDLPKTISGKIRRVELRMRAATGGGSASEFREEQFSELG